MFRSTGLIYSTFMFVMVKLILSLAHVWVLFSTAAALQCQIFTDPQCSNTALRTCSSETMCITATIQATSSETTKQQIYKACASSSLCPTAGSQTFSTNLGVSGAVASTQCCNTDDCNSQTLDFPAAQTRNNLHCCDSITSVCSTPLQCQGVEDSCFKARVMRGARLDSVFGCTSANLCSAASSLVTLPFFQSFGNITSGPMCCGTSLCNRSTVKRRVSRDTNTTTAGTTNTTTAGTTNTTTAATTNTTTPTTIAATTPSPPTTTTASTAATTSTPPPTTAATTTPPPTTIAATTPATTTTTAAATTPTTTTASTAATTTTTTAATTTPPPTTIAATTPTTTTTTTAATTPTTTTTTTTTTTAAKTSNAVWCIRLNMIHLLLGLFIFSLY